MNLQLCLELSKLALPRVTGYAMGTGRYLAKRGSDGITISYFEKLLNEEHLVENFINFGYINCMLSFSPFLPLPCLSLPFSFLCLSIPLPSHFLSLSFIIIFDIEYLTDKSGVPPDSVNDLVSHVLSNCPNLKLAGLMTIGAFDHDLSTGPNPDFQVWTVVFLIFVHI